MIIRRNQILSLSLLCTAVLSLSNLSHAALFKRISLDSEYQAAMWDTRTIPVCWESSAYAKSKYEPLRNLVRQAVMDTWEANSQVRFTKWYHCKTSEPEGTIRINIDNTKGSSSLVGMEYLLSNNAMSLNFEYELDNYEACRADLNACIYGVAVHEFGHALGLLHEEQRTNIPSDATSHPNYGHVYTCNLSQTNPNGFAFGAYDPESVMNSCNIFWRDGVLSDGDINFIQAYYFNQYVDNDFDKNGISDFFGISSSGSLLVNFFSNGKNYSFGHSSYTFKGIGDFDADGQADVLWQNPQNLDVVITHYSNTGQLQREVILQSGLSASWKIRGTGDFNYDGRTDILWQNSQTGQVYIYLVEDDRWHGNKVSVVKDNDWQVIKIADFNGDHKADILWRHAVTGKVWLYTMNGTNIASSKLISDVSTTWDIIAVADVTNDQRADIIWRNRNTGQHWLYIMNGHQIVKSKPFFDILANGDWFVESSGDFDGDGDTDFLLGNNNNTSRQLVTMNGENAPDISDFFNMQQYDIK